MAERTGKDRASIANFLRLLKLPDEVRTEVASGRLSMGHARSLLSLADEADQRRIARDVRKVLQAAIANAENNHQLDVDRLFVKEATVGRADVPAWKTR